MTPIIVAIGTVLSLYIFEPLWFDTRMHYFHQTYETDKACSLAAHQQKDVTGAKYAEYCRKTITTVNDVNFLGSSTRYV